MAGPSCHNCVFSICDQELWLGRMARGEPVLPQCANHPRWPGQLHDVPGLPCRNYQRQPALPQDDNVRWIPLSDGHYAYVDAADYPRLRRWHWCALSSGYAARYEKGKLVYMHRQILQPPQGAIVDHSDGNRVNNCRSNLRLCTRQENMHNKRKNGHSASQFKGVGYLKWHRKWYARICCMGERIWLGYFAEEVEAARAYDRKAVELFGEFARLNFPREWPPERRAEVRAQGRVSISKPRAQRKAAGRKSRKPTAGPKPSLS